MFTEGSPVDCAIDVPEPQDAPSTIEEDTHKNCNVKESLKCGPF